MAVGKSVRHKTKTIKKAGSKHKVLKKAFHTWPLPTSNNAVAVLQSVWNHYYQHVWQGKNVDCRIDTLRFVDASTTSPTTYLPIPGTHWHFSITYYVYAATTVTRVSYAIKIDKSTGNTTYDTTDVSFPTKYTHDVFTPQPGDPLLTTYPGRLFTIADISKYIMYLLQIKSTPVDNGVVQLVQIGWSQYEAQWVRPDGSIQQNAFMELMPGPIGYTGINTTPLETGKIDFNAYCSTSGYPEPGLIPLDPTLNPNVRAIYAYDSNTNANIDPNYVTGTCSVRAVRYKGVGWCSDPNIDSTIYGTNTVDHPNPVDMYMTTHFSYADRVLLGKQEQSGLHALDIFDYWQEVILP